MRVLKKLALYVYVLNYFFEVPSWCYRDDSIKDKTYCNAEEFPNSNLPKMPFVATVCIALACLAILLFFAFFRRTFRIASRTAPASQVRVPRHALRP